MTIEKLQRVMWRLRKNNPGNDTPTFHALHQSIIQECGTTPETYRNNRRALTILGWIKSYNTKRVKITNKDLTDA